ncbi:MAG: imidazole glycerol phosphate synthase subunit HisH [Rhodanobacteraceae bacterium]
MSTNAYIVAAGGANYGSLREACRRIGVDAELGDDPKRIAAATHVILPGVGAAGHAMGVLRERGLDSLLARLTQPLLGICLGMQLLFERSDEDDVAGIGLLSGRVRRLPAAPSWPHMGWNTCDANARHPLLQGIATNDWFYFVHGYAAAPGSATIAESRHGDAFAAVVAQRNVHGVQFHPEKSGAPGRRVLTNFFALA